jgi:hypothetical protein
MKKPRRPFPITILALIVLGLAMLNLARCIQAMAKWQFLAGLLPFSPIYLIATGAIWGVSGLALFWALWKGFPWAPKTTILGMFAYSAYYWLDRFLLAGYADRNVDWPFCTVGNLIFIAASLWDLTRPDAKAYFGENHERRQN